MMPLPNISLIHRTWNRTQKSLEKLMSAHTFWQFPSPDTAFPTGASLWWFGHLLLTRHSPPLPAPPDFSRLCSAKLSKYWSPWQQVEPQHARMRRQTALPVATQKFSPDRAKKGRALSGRVNPEAGVILPDRSALLPTLFQENLSPYSFTQSWFCTCFTVGIRHSLYISSNMSSSPQL